MLSWWVLCWNDGYQCVCALDAQQREVRLVVASIKSLYKSINWKLAGMFAGGFATALALTFTYLNLVDSRQAMRIDTYEKYSSFVRDAVENQKAACNSDGGLRGLYKDRYEAFAEVIDDLPIPCLPGPVSNLKIEITPSQ